MSATGLELRSVVVRLGGRSVIDQASLAVSPGELVALLGPNGAGKTTLLRAALGLVRPSGGEILVGGQRIGAVPLRARAGLLAWLPQQALVSEALSALETVVAARYRFDETRGNARAAARRALARLGIASLAETPVTSLSGGERQRVSLAALVAQEAKLCLLDEPANHLDPAQQAETYALIGALVREGVGVLAVTHDVNLLAHAGVRVHVAGLADGKVTFETDYGADDLPARLAELFGVPMTPVTVGERRLIVASPKPGGAR